MKKKILISFITMFTFILYVMNQFANAQSQNGNVQLNQQSQIPLSQQSQPQAGVIPVLGCHCLPGGYSSCQYCNMWGKLACVNYCRSHNREMGGSPQTQQTFLAGIYPNPVSQSTIIKFYAVQNQNASVKIYDMTGRLVETLTDAKFEEGEHELEWNVSDVNAGMYFIKNGCRKLFANGKNLGSKIKNNYSNNLYK